MRPEYLEAIKRFEGFAPRARWDHAQHTNGYGTRARFPGEEIDRAEAERRFAVEIADARAAVAGFAPGLDEGTAAALASLTFNAGSGWMRSGLGAAVKSGDVEAARQIFTQYVRAGGQVLPGLVARRAAEVQWMEATASATSQPAAPVMPPGAASVPTQGEPSAALSAAALPGAGIARSLTIDPVRSSAGARHDLGETTARAFLLESIAAAIARPKTRNDEDAARRSARA